MNLRRPPRRQLHAPPPMIFRWDLDKTYLKSEFHSLRELVRIPFEKAEDKIAVPGVVPLIRSLRDTATQAGREVRVYFISASPPQIAKAIKEKLALDGIEHDGIVFKNQLQHLARGRFRNLREHVGYKLTEILKGRHTLPPESREILFGDDWESDPLIYSLYADILAGRMAADELADILEAIGVDPDLIMTTKELTTAIEPAEVVSRIYINLERRTPPLNFRAFGPRLVPTFNYFQTAACLYQDGQLSLSGVVRVAEGLTTGAGYSPYRLANSLADITRRGHMDQASAIAIREYLRARGLFPQHRRDQAAVPAWRNRVALAWRRLWAWLHAPPASAPATSEAIDYHMLVSQWRAAR